MEHKNKKFKFFDKDGGEVQFITRRYCFNTEAVIKDRFGDYESLMDHSDAAIELSISLKDVSEDFPKLLESLKPETEIDWAEQDYDILLSVYAFFLMYKKNAIARELIYNKEMLASEMEKAKVILSSMPNLISQSMNSLNTENL